MTPPSGWTPGFFNQLKVLGLSQPVESTSPFKVMVSDVVNLHPYMKEVEGVIRREVNVRQRQSYDRCEMDENTGLPRVPVENDVGDGLCEPGFEAYDDVYTRDEATGQDTMARQDLTQAVLVCPPDACALQDLEFELPLPPDAEEEEQPPKCKDFLYSTAGLKLVQTENPALVSKDPDGAQRPQAAHLPPSLLTFPVAYIERQRTTTTC